jgi:hypothetical protein
MRRRTGDAPPVESGAGRAGQTGASGCVKIIPFDRSRPDRTSASFLIGLNRMPA